MVGEPNLDALKIGVANMDKHLDNIASFGQTAVVAFNRYGDDVQDEIDFVRQHCAERGIGFAVNNAFVEGGTGAMELAELVVRTIEENPSKELKFTYSDEDDVKTKVSKVAQNIYGAKNIKFSATALKKIAMIEELGYSSFPVCIAKTQYSFSTDPKRINVPKDFDFNVQDIVINAGAEMLVVISGDIMRMPGLPKSPQALRIDIVDGEIEGLS
jgi:formate--tetrahydrofolate ligase